MAAGQTAKKRVLVVAAEDYTGKSPNVNAGYAAAPALPGAARRRARGRRLRGRDASTSTLRPPTAARRTASSTRRSSTRPPSACSRTSTRSTTTRATTSSRRTSTETNPRRLSSATAQTGSFEMAPWAHKVMIELREYANEGGKLLVDGRNVHQTFTSNSASLSATGPYTWTPDKLYGFFYPPNNGGDDDLPGTAWQRSRDDLQRHVAELPRRRRPSVGHRHERARARGHPPVPPSTNPSTNNNPLVSPYPVAPKAGGILAGMAPLVIDQSATTDPNQAADGSALPQARKPAAPARLGTARTSRCAPSASRPTTPRRSPTRPRVARSSPRGTR